MASTANYIVISQHHYKDTNTQYATLLVSSGDYNLADQCVRSYLDEIMFDSELEYTTNYGQIHYLNVSKTTPFAYGRPPFTSQSPSVPNDLQGKKGGYIISLVFGTIDRPNS